MKKLAIFLLLSCAAVAQLPLPNISYTSTISGSCSTGNLACSNALFITGTSAYGTTGSAFILGSGATLDIAVAHYNAATVTVSGTYANLTLNFDFSDPTGGGGTNYFQEICARTDINVLESTEAVTANATRAWQCPVWAATRFRVRNSNASLTGAPLITIILTTAAIDPSLIVAASPPVVPGSTDPCQDLSQQKSSAFANITTATTTALVAPSGTTNIYVCSYEITSASTTTANTVILENGTGAACATSPTALSPTMTNGLAATPATQIWRRQGGATLFPTGTSQGLCVLSTVGSTPNIQVWISFVQQ